MGRHSDDHSLWFQVLVFGAFIGGVWLAYQALTRGWLW